MFSSLSLSAFDEREWKWIEYGHEIISLFCQMQRLTYRDSASIERESQRENR